MARAPLSGSTLPTSKKTQLLVWKRRRGAPVPYCRWERDRRGCHERWVSEYMLPQGHGGDHGLSKGHKGVRNMITVRCENRTSRTLLSHLIKYGIFNLRILVLSRFWVIAGWFTMGKSLRKRKSKLQMSYIFLQMLLAFLNLQHLFTSCITFTLL